MAPKTCFSVSFLPRPHLQPPAISKSLDRTRPLKLLLFMVIGVLEFSRDTGPIGDYMRKYKTGIASSSMKARMSHNLASASWKHEESMWYLQS